MTVWFHRVMGVAKCLSAILHSSQSLYKPSNLFFTTVGDLDSGASAQAPKARDLRVTSARLQWLYWIHGVHLKVYRVVGVFWCLLAVCCSYWLEGCGQLWT